MSAAIAKDGPSAGCAITLSLLSLLKEYHLPADFAITGEISLSGKVKFFHFYFIGDENWRDVREDDCSKSSGS